MIEQKLPLSIGTIIKDVQNTAYTVEDILGQGGFGSVYLVRDQSTGQRLFALKELITPKSQGKFHLTFEAEVLMRLHHPSLPHIYKVFEDTSCNRTYLLMDYIEGKDLEMLREEQTHKNYPLILVVLLMNPIVEAISYLHSQTPPIVHRDIKPANIIVPTKSRDAFLVDFGLAKEYIKNKTTNIVRYGTPGYAAPEQYGQGTSLQTDVYGLAATIYTLLTGTIPLDAVTRSLNKQANDPLKRADQLNPSIPPAIGKILNRALNLQPEKRYASVDKFWHEFTMAAELYAISGTETKTPITQTLLSPLPSRQLQTTPFATLPITPLPPQLAATSSAALEPPIRRPRRPALLIMLSTLIMLMLGTAIGSFSWLVSGFHNSRNSHTTPLATPGRHHSSVISTATCVPSHARKPDRTHAQIASCSSPTTPTPATTTTSFPSSTHHSTPPTATPTLLATNPTPSPVNRSSSMTTPTSATATPTPAAAAPTPSTASHSSSNTTHASATATPASATPASASATPTSSVAGSIISTTKNATSGINLPAP